MSEETFVKWVCPDCGHCLPFLALSDPKQLPPLCSECGALLDREQAEEGGRQRSVTGGGR